MSGRPVGVGECRSAHHHYPTSLRVPVRLPSAVVASFHHAAKGIISGAPATRAAGGCTACRRPRYLRERIPAVHLVAIGSHIAIRIVSKRTRTLIQGGTCTT